MPNLPPYPRGAEPGSKAWLDWINAIQNILGGTSGTIPWTTVDKTGSNLTDLATRQHNDLQSIQGGAANEAYHLTSAQHLGLTGGGQTFLHGHSIASITEYLTGTWSPVFTGLTETGIVTKTGIWTRIGRMVFYSIDIVPDSGATSSSTSGTTYHDFPVGLLPAGDDILTAVNAVTHAGIGSGHIDSTTDRGYTPSWGATGNKIVISGQYRI